MFRGQMDSLFVQEECDDALRNTRPIKVGDKNLRPADLHVIFGVPAVEKAQRAWSIILEKVTVPSLVEQLQALGSPSEAWELMVEMYTALPTTAKEILEQEWINLEMQVGETPTLYFARAKTLRTKREKHGVTLSDSESNRHIARRLSSDYALQKSMLLISDEISTETLERTVKKAHGELELERSREGQGKGVALISAAGAAELGTGNTS
ncbi:unnamed protein product, partial [Pylaiella littoralis]